MAGNAPRPLLPHHKKLIKASAIKASVEEARGYRSVTKPAGLLRRGFNEKQSLLVPALLIPIWDVWGKNTRFQSRPDEPRLSLESGNPIKYENLPGVGVTLDINPRVLKKVKDKDEDWWITEGARKGDALASQDVAAIALYSVWNWRGTDESGTLAALPDWDQLDANGRTIYIVFDSDVMLKRSVKLALERLGRWLERKEADVWYVYLKPTAKGQKQGVDDYLYAGGTVDDLVDLAEDRVRGLPEVVVNNRELRNKVSDGVRALELANNPPQTFWRGRDLVRIQRTSDGQPVIERYNASSLPEQLSNVADWVSYGEKKVSQVDPPGRVVSSILGRESWPTFPVLDTLVESPTLRPKDGSIIDRPGYDPDTRLVYLPSEDLVVPAIPAEPTQADASAAAEGLDEVYVNFPFKDAASRANLFALQLTPILRPAILGPVPLALLQAPQVGTGKTLLAEVVALLATGRPIAVTTAPLNEEEWPKKITAMLLRGSSFVLIDNVKTKLESAALSSVLTGSGWDDRILGVSEMTGSLPIQVTWAATGNNLSVDTEIVRRSYSIDLNAETPDPWLDRQTQTFLHPDLLTWVAEERGRLLAMLLTVARAWWVAKKPPPKQKVPTLGKFEKWNSMLSGILEYAGVHDFRGNQRQMMQAADTTATQKVAFFRAWKKVFGKQRVFTRDVVAEIRANAVFRDALPDEVAEWYDSPGLSFERRLGKWLSKQTDTYFQGNLYLAGKLDAHTGKMRWRIETD